MAIRQAKQNEDQPADNTRLITVPNILCVLRIALTPVVAWLLIDDAYMVALWIFLIAGISDGFDGFIARSFHQTSRVGMFLDPIADKLLVNVTFIVLAALELLPWWFVALVFLRDALFALAYSFAEVKGKKADVAPMMISKVNTTLQIALGGAVMAQIAYDWPIQNAKLALVAVVVVTSVLSALGYFARWIRVLRNGSSSAQ